MNRAFEEAIQTYVGDDPLDNWYNYISWVEQSYPKHGHEGNLVAVLEDCVSTFENDERYRNDPRMCKLWIKYVSIFLDLIFINSRLSPDLIIVLKFHRLLDILLYFKFIFYTYQNEIKWISWWRYL